MEAQEWNHMWNIVGSNDAEPQCYLWTQPPKNLQQQWYLQGSSQDFQVPSINTKEFT